MRLRHMDAALEHRWRDHPPEHLSAAVHERPVAAQPCTHGCVDVALDDVEGALQVALGRTDVEPVALGGKAVQPIADQ